MKLELKSSLSHKKSLSALSVFCFLSGVVCVLAGDIALPLPIGFLAAIYLFDNDSSRKFSYVNSVLLIALNLLGLYFEICFSAFGFASVFLAFIMAKACRQGSSKADSAYIMTIVCALFSLVGYALFAMNYQGAYTLDAVSEFYSTLVNSLRIIYVNTLSEAYNTAGIQVKNETITLMFDTQLYMIISYILISSFTIVGLSFKLFGSVVSKRVEDNSDIKSWRFTPTKLYAYFYVILAFVSIFAISSNNVFSVSVNNLYNVFMYIFAYVGFSVALDILKKKFKPATSVILLVIGCVILLSVAAQLLAVLGAIYTIRRQNEEKIISQ